jgi:hypothetical protein
MDVPPFSQNEYLAWELTTNTDGTESEAATSPLGTPHVKMQNLATLPPSAA